MSMWESGHLDQTFLGGVEGAGGSPSTAAMARDLAGPQDSPSGTPMMPRQLPLFLGFTKNQVFLIAAVAFAVWWFGPKLLNKRRGRKSRA